MEPLTKNEVISTLTNSLLSVYGVRTIKIVFGCNNCVRITVIPKTWWLFGGVYLNISAKVMMRRLTKATEEAVKLFNIKRLEITIAIDQWELKQG